MSTDAICRDGGADLISEHVDKAYAIDEIDQVENDLAKFLDYTWKKNVSIENFTSGFHTRVDKISELKLDEKLKGHLILRQMTLANYDRHVAIGAESECYEVNHVTAVLRNIFRNRITTEASLLGGPSNSRDQETHGHANPTYRGSDTRRQRAIGHNNTNRGNNGNWNGQEAK